MRIIIALCFCLLFLNAVSQRRHEWGIAITNSNTAYPFSTFGGLFQSPFHPGVELSYGFNWKTKPKHDWYQEVKLGYFYHRFVQHAIELYTDVGYRYKFSSRFYAQGALGAGYLHSVPATAKLKLDDDGTYRNDKGIGRMQAMLVFNAGVGYVVNPGSQKPVSVFATYQQVIQTPFVASYVPLLPYNCFMLGARISMKNKQQVKSPATTK